MNNKQIWYEDSFNNLSPERGKLERREEAKALSFLFFTAGPWSSQDGKSSLSCHQEGTDSNVKDDYLNYKDTRMRVTQPQGDLSFLVELEVV